MASSAVDGTVTAASPGSRGRLRVAAGVVLMAVAAVVGYVTIGSEQPQTTAWVAVHPLAAGSMVSGDSFERVAMTVPDPAVFWPGDVAPAGVVVTALAPGHPLMATGVADRQREDVRTLTLTLPPERIPPGLAMGDRVDVWLGGESRPPSLAVEDVAVSAVSGDAQMAALGQVAVDVRTSDVSEAVRAASSDDVVLVRRPAVQ